MGQSVFFQVWNVGKALIKNSVTIYIKLKTIIFVDSLVFV